MLTFRLLLVEDYEPFRRLVHSILQPRAEFQIIGQASDGLEAIQKAQELQPDLIVLDIGLPSLNGIEAARRIRRLLPECKILFLSQESSADAVQEALDLGARGYVVKSHAGTELLPALDAVLQGNQYVSNTVDRDHPLTFPMPTVPPKGQASRSHAVQFYGDDSLFIDGFTRFIEPALRAGDAVIVVATESRRDGILQQLREHGWDTDAAIENGTYVSLDVAGMLSTFMVNDFADPLLFFSTVGDLFAVSARATAKQHPRIVVCGECASILWEQGKADAALQVEQFCNQLVKQYDVDILCGFLLSESYCEEDQQVFQKICLGH